jgi:hypothetical protein
VLEREFERSRFPHNLNLSRVDSDLRIQIQLDPRYDAFVYRATLRDVLGLRVPVATVEDILPGKIWAVQDVTRLGGKRQKDLTDIARVLERFPYLRSTVPLEIFHRLVWSTRQRSGWPRLRKAYECQPERKGRSVPRASRAIEIARQHVSFQPDSIVAERAVSDGRPVWRVALRGRLPGQDRPSCRP